MTDLTAYEQERKERVAANKRKLIELGLEKVEIAQPVIKKKKRKPKEKGAQPVRASGRLAALPSKPSVMDRVHSPGSSHGKKQKRKAGRPGAGMRSGRSSGSPIPSLSSGKLRGQASPIRSPRTRYAAFLKSKYPGEWATPDAQATASKLQKQDVKEVDLSMYGTPQIDRLQDLSVGEKNRLHAVAKAASRHASADSGASTQDLPDTPGIGSWGHLPKMQKVKGHILRQVHAMADDYRGKQDITWKQLKGDKKLWAEATDISSKAATKQNATNEKLLRTVGSNSRSNKSVKALCAALQYQWREVDVLHLLFHRFKNYTKVVNYSSAANPDRKEKGAGVSKRVAYSQLHKDSSGKGSGKGSKTAKGNQTAKGGQTAKGSSSSHKQQGSTDSNGNELPAVVGSAVAADAGLPFDGAAADGTTQTQFGVGIQISAGGTGGESSSSDSEGADEHTSSSGEERGEDSSGSEQGGSRSEGNSNGDDQGDSEDVNSGERGSRDDSSSEGGSEGGSGEDSISDEGEDPDSQGVEEAIDMQDKPQRQSQTPNGSASGAGSNGSVPVGNSRKRKQRGSPGATDCVGAASSKKQKQGPSDTQSSDDFESKLAALAASSEDAARLLAQLRANTAKPVPIKADPEGTRVDKKGHILSKGDAVKVLDPQGRIAALGNVVLVGSNDTLKPGGSKAIVGDGNVGVGELVFKDSHEKAAKATVLWVTQGRHLVAGRHNMWEKKQLLSDPQTIIAVPAVRLKKV